MALTYLAIKSLEHENIKSYLQFVDNVIVHIVTIIIIFFLSANQKCLGWLRLKDRFDFAIF